MTKITKIKAIALASMLCVSAINLAYADNNSDGSVNTQGAGTSLVIPVPQYDSGQLAQAGCDQNVWNQMVTDYQNKALTQAAIGEKTAQLQATRAPSPVSSCFDAAVQLINNATRAYNTIAALLTGGGLDSSMLYAYAQKLVVGAACSQVNSLVNQSGLGTQINNVNGQIGGALNTGTNIGGVNTGSVNQILNGGGYQQNNSGNVPYVNSNGLANSTGATGVLNSINPFK